jgi:hypothetical protein
VVSGTIVPTKGPCAMALIGKEATKDGV